MSPEPQGSRQGRTAVSSPDNGAAYRSDLHRLACGDLGLRHLLTQPYRPRTNGKAERFIQTLVNRWAYGRTYRSSAERTTALGP
jgi:transposase InsO family protein